MKKTLALSALLALPAGSAFAHAVGVSRGEYRVSGSRVAVELIFARPELASSVPSLDPDGDGSVSAEEVAAAHPLLARAFLQTLELRTTSGRCSEAFEGALTTEGDGIMVRALYRCPDTVRTLSLQVGFFDSLSLGHRHLVTARAGPEPARAVAYEARPAVELLLDTPTPSREAAGVVRSFFGLGIEHILTGYDHLVFLLALILVGGRLRSLLVVVTAFTLAHSITLALAVLGVWAPSPGLVEPAIALSIAYVGIENWFVRDARRRWMITFPFGLVHGFGFAGALREVALPSEQVPLALAAFNLGVEAGQVAVLVLLLPVVLWLGGRTWFAASGIKATSALITFAGLSWFVSRVA
jgi:hydrogenase/urease accessory protein HupE